MKILILQIIMSIQLGKKIINTITNYKDNYNYKDEK